MAKGVVANVSPKAKSRRRARGRSIIGLLLIGFVLVASAVIWRRSYGFTLSRELVQIDRHRTQLQGELARLRSDIRDESSRSKLGPVVQRLGMHVPNDKQVRILPR
jgi:cell division protein FtsL